MTRILVVGLGQMGGYYINNLKISGFDESQIIGVDWNEEARKKAAEKWSGMEVFSEISDISEIPKVAIVASTTVSHFQNIMYLIEAGVRYIFCEKPISMKMEESEEIMKAASKTGTEIFVAYLINFSGAVQRLTEIMVENDLILAELDSRWGKNRFGDSRPTPGALVDEIVHSLGVALSLLGVNQELETVQAFKDLSYFEYADQEAQKKANQKDSSFPLKGITSSVFVRGRYETNLLCGIFSIQASFILGRQARRISCVLTDKEGNLRLAVELNFDVKRDGGNFDTLDITEYEGNVVHPQEVFQNNKILSELQAFLAVVAGEKQNPCLTDINEAVKIQKIITV